MTLRSVWPVFRSVARCQQSERKASYFTAPLPKSSVINGAGKGNRTLALVFQGTGRDGCYGWLFWLVLLESWVISEVTQILEALEHGDPHAAEQLLPLVYDELRKLAASKMANEMPDQTLQPTALVHEAWLRLTDDENRNWNGRAHFFGAAAEAMRRILIDNARRKRAARHGGGQLRVDVQEVEIVSASKDDELIAVHEVLERFAERDKQKAELVKLRYFVGMTTEEAAEVLGISIPTADRWWNFSRAWLFEEIERQRKDT
jgi:RNA polymerase sigma factor (TIGR02999 family)